MPSYRVQALVPERGILREVTVTAESRGTAITEAAQRLEVHRDLIVSCKSLNPASGGGSRRG